MIHLDLKERVNDGAELWLAFDAFCNQAAGSPAGAVVMVFCPRERASLQVIVDRARRGDLNESSVQAAKDAMEEYYGRGSCGTEETVLILE